MKMRLVILILTVFTLTSCKPKLEKPQPFLDQNTMISLLTEVHELEGTFREVNSTKYQKDSMRIFTNTGYNTLFEKYNIDDRAFQDNIYYYCFYHKKFEKVYSAITEYFNAADSLLNEELFPKNAPMEVLN